VVSRIRLYDLMGQVGDSVLTPELTARLARRAGATELVEGTFYRTGRDSFRLDLRRVDLATGTVRRAYTARGTSVFELADGATRELAADLQVRTAVTATGTGEGSLSARRLFDEGLRRYYTGGIREAGDLFESALGEDSTFALAAYYAAVSRGWEDPFEALELLRRAVRLGDHATQRDRLTIQLAWAIRTNDTAMVTLADSLSRRYPDDPETRFAAGEAHAWAGDPWGALPHFRRVITLDSAGLLGTVPRCRACDAYAGLASAYLQLDSLAAAERALREMLAARPDWTRGWMDLGRVLAQEGRGTDAMATLRAGGRSLQQPTGEVFGAELQLILGNTADAEQQLAGMARYGSQATRREALWLLVIAERYRGRLAGALAAARQLRALDDSMPGGETVHFDGRVAEAQVRLEMGDGAGAARLFATLAAQSPLAGAEITGVRARKRAFDLARLAMALDATGDTIQLPGLADSVRVWGRRSAYSRDRTLAPHLDGLIARRRGDLDSAARAFRSALVLPGTGLSRTNYELARVALAQGRAAAAIGPLQAILHRDIQGSNFYLTMPEAHLLLAEAFDSAGLADSAAVHYRVVARSWAGGDPPFRARAAHAERRIRQLTF
ncbi:MAG TPA: tetratricopeptide repeat protein, partial [Gemmatimonadales bacterium]|nr:tetratricopeptide repeat protein [Gemmatimonadales bacterium]